MSDNTEFQELGIVEEQQLEFSAVRNEVTEGLTAGLVFFRASKTIFNIDGVKGAGVVGLEKTSKPGGKTALKLLVKIRKSYGHNWEDVRRELDKSFQLALY